MPKRHH